MKRPFPTLWAALLTAWLGSVTPPPPANDDHPPEPPREKPEPPAR